MTLGNCRNELGRYVYIRGIDIRTNCRGSAEVQKSVEAVPTNSIEHGKVMVTRQEDSGSIGVGQHHERFEHPSRVGSAVNVVTSEHELVDAIWQDLEQLAKQFIIAMYVTYYPDSTCQSSTFRIAA